MNSQDYMKMDDDYAAHTYDPIKVVVERGDGVWVYDVEGHRYLDCLSSYSAVNQGHCHPHIIEAATAQMHKVTLTSRAFYNDQMGPFLKQLCELTGYEMALPMNSGAEAVETAIKAARMWGYRAKGVAHDQAEIIVCDGNFAGRTITLISFSSEKAYKADFGPLTPGFKSIPYGDADALAAAITPNTVAFLVEPIQGEGGVNVPPAGYLRRVADICAANNVLFMADEIQTGLGRTGALLACDHDGVRPDVVTLGKALSGGFYPVSAVLADQRVLGLFRPGDHGSTFGGNPLASAVGRAALDVLVDEGLVERSREVGAYFKGRLERLESDHIVEVRGKGLLIGVELDVPARPYCDDLRDAGILCKDTHNTVVRFAPPLVITKEQVDWAMERIGPILSNGKR
ncbi:MAG: ornithine--oxo-acid transaminase [Chloroflexota bacterium]